MLGLMPGMCLTAYGWDPTYYKLRLENGWIENLGTNMDGKLSYACNLIGIMGIPEPDPEKETQISVDNTEVVDIEHSDLSREGLLTLYILGEGTATVSFSYTSTSGEPINGCLTIIVAQQGHVLCVNLNQTATVTVDDKTALMATVEPSDATDKTLKWTVSGEAVVLYSDEACTKPVGTDATETTTVYAKGMSADSATVTVTSNSDSSKTASCEVTVSKANPTATAPTATATYGQALSEVTLTNPAGNTSGTWAWADEFDPYNTPVGNVGVKIFRANFTPTDTTNYNTVENVDVEVTVEKANLILSIHCNGCTYGEHLDASATYNTDYDGAVTFTFYRSDGTTKTTKEDGAETEGGPPTNAGYYTIVANATESDNYKSLTQTSQATIRAKTVSVSGITAVDKSYDDTTAAPLNYTGATFDGICEGDALTVTATGTFDNPNVGEGKAVTISNLTLGGAQAGNYALAENGQQTTATATINKAPLTVTAKPRTITYGDAPANDGVTYSGFVNNETEGVLGGTLDYDYSYAQYGNVGSAYTITPKGLTSDYYEITFKPGSLTVGPKEVGLSWNTAPLTFNGLPQAPTATATGTVNNDAISVTVSGGQTDAGTGYTATASGLTGEKAGNYKLPDAKTTHFSIVKAEAQKIDDVTKDQVFTLTNVSASVKDKMPENAGTLTYTAGTATRTGSVTVSNFAVDESGKRDRCTLRRRGK